MKYNICINKNLTFSTYKYYYCNKIENYFLKYFDVMFYYRKSIRPTKYYDYDPRKKNIAS